MRASEGEHLHWEGGHETRGKVDKVNLARLLGTLQWEEIAHDDDDHKVRCVRSGKLLHENRPRHH